MEKRNPKNKTITTSELCRRIGFGVSVDFLKSHGIAPALDGPTATYWLESDFQQICTVIATTLSKKAERASGYTPGPWIANVYPPDRCAYIDADFGGQGKAIGHVFGIEGDEDEFSIRDANARLICAAPDMLAALQELARYFIGEYAKDPRSDNEIDRDKEQAQLRARNVIAKATGTTNTQE